MFLFRWEKNTNEENVCKKMKLSAPAPELPSPGTAFKDNFPEYKEKLQEKKLEIQNEIEVKKKEIVELEFAVASIDLQLHYLG